jgi:hypothetical protein
VSETRVGWLKCAAISPGQFSNERAVRLQEYSGRACSLFADVEHLRLEEVDGVEQGRIGVEVLSRQGELALVRLPVEPFETGRHLTVHENELNLPKKKRVKKAK